MSEQKASGLEPKAGGRGKSLAAPYAAGLFSMGQAELLTFLVPLWAVLQGASPAEIGLLVGAKSLLTFFLAIHGGALMDRFGARRLMVYCALISVVTLPMFPIVGWLPAVFALQMLSGFGSAMGWLGAQTLFGQSLRANHLYAGRFSFCIRMGGFVGPPIAGLAWDHIGIGGGFGFLALWAMGTVVSSLCTPKIGSAPEAGQRLRAADILPRMADYRTAFRLAAIPAMTAVLMVTVIRIAASSVRPTVRLR